MAKYKVGVMRISYSGYDTEVEADDERQAKKIAMDEAGNHVFVEGSAEYEVDYVTKID